MHIIKIFSLSLTLLFSACATRFEYEDIESKSASIVVTSHRDLTKVQVCQPNRKGTIISYDITKVEADVPTYISISKRPSFSSKGTCNRNITFSPTAGKDYRLNVHYVNRQCYLSVTNYSSSNSKIIINDVRNSDKPEGIKYRYLVKNEDQGNCASVFNNESNNNKIDDEIKKFDDIRRAKDLLEELKNNQKNQ